MSPPPFPSLPPIPSSIPPDDLLILHTSTPTWPRPSSSSSSPVHISVLDSSFNPPTLAHLAMASSSFPPPLHTSRSSSSSSGRKTEGYTARLLLFSSTNVDKTPRPTDPSMRQRAEMMLLLAKRLSTSPEPVAIGLLNQPTFAGKARVIHSYLKTQDRSEGLDVRLTFLIGTDTLTRFFDPKYYTSFDGGMAEALGGLFGSGSTVISARRGSDSQSRRVEDAILAGPDVVEWVKEGKIRLLGEGDEDWVGISSTAVREALKKGDEDGLKGLVMDEVAEYVERDGLYE